MVLMLLVAGCITQPEPIVDLEGVDPEVYAVDRQQCEARANEGSVTGGAADDAATGAVIGAATGDISGDVGQGAGYGNSYEGTRTGADAEREKHRVLANCLRARGYTVLN
jgi:hypothetical protein